MKISVILTSFNYSQYIEQAINSVISQTFSDWELIVVDDGSSDASVELIQSFCEKDSRIKLVQHEHAQNRGLKESILLGVEKAKGEWVAFLESDDSFEPDNLAKKAEIVEKLQMEELSLRENDCLDKHPVTERSSLVRIWERLHNPSADNSSSATMSTVKFIFNKVNFLVENEPKQFEKFKKTQEKLSKIKFPRNMFYDFNIQNQVLTFSSVMVKKATLGEINFDVSLFEFLDWWLWIQLAYKNEFYYVDEALTNWRLHSKSYISKDKKPPFHFTQLKAYFDIYKQNPQNIKLLIFILSSLIIIIFVKSFNCIKRG